MGEVPQNLNIQTKVEGKIIANPDPRLISFGPQDQQVLEAMQKTVRRVEQEQMAANQPTPIEENTQPKNPIAFPLEFSVSSSEQQDVSSEI